MNSEAEEKRPAGSEAGKCQQLLRGFRTERTTLLSTCSGMLAVRGLPASSGFQATPGVPRARGRRGPGGAARTCPAPTPRAGDPGPRAAPVHVEQKHCRERADGPQSPKPQRSSQGAKAQCIGERRPHQSSSKGDLE